MTNSFVILYYYYKNKLKNNNNYCRNKIFLYIQNQLLWHQNLYNNYFNVTQVLVKQIKNKKENYTSLVKCPHKFSHNKYIYII